jgi:transposase
MEKDKKSYSLEFKLKAVELSNQRGSIQEVAKELGINKESLRNWKRGRYLGKSDSSANSVQKSKEEEENRRLRKELYEVKLERDILKKAVSIFSKSDR